MKGFTNMEIALARRALMTGERATPPKWRAIRKTILRLRKGGNLKGGWRSWPKEQVA